MKIFKTLLAYFLVGGLSLSFAVLMASNFLTPSSAQQGEQALPPPPLPPEVIPQPPAVNVPDTSALQDATSEAESFLAPFIYDAETRRDPFKEYLVEVLPQEKLQEAALIGPLAPLQRYELDGISLVGIIWDVTKPKAMFMDPNNQIHIIGRDERVGRKNGYIAAIREGEVVIIETIKIRGQLAFSTRVLKLPR